MTPETDEMRELDAWIDQSVFGNEFKCLHGDIETLGGTLMRCKSCGKQFGQTTLAYSRMRVPLYTTNPAAAMEVLKKCLEVTECRIVKHRDGKFGIIAQRDTVAPTLELAIARFAHATFSQPQKDQK